MNILNELDALISWVNGAKVQYKYTYENTGWLDLENINDADYIPPCFNSEDSVEFRYKP